MKPIRIRWLLFAAGVVCAAYAIIAWGRFQLVPHAHWAYSLAMLLLAVVCIVFAQRIRNAVEKNRIGQDRSQVSPVFAAYSLALGQTCAWSGSVFAGAYGGMATYVVPKSFINTAAFDDLPAVMALLVSALVLAGAGLYLERSCQVPPEDSALAGGGVPGQS